MNIAIIFAGGTGTRMGAELPKQFIEIQNKPILIHTLELYQNHKKIDKIYISILKEYFEYTEKLVQKYNISKVAGIVCGGETGMDSIYNALSLAYEENDGDSIVLISDGVRPLITDETIDNNIAGVIEKGNAITTTACFETILLSEDGGQTVKSVPIRRHTFAAQAPQSFYLKDIIEAHNEVRRTPTRYTDLVDSCTLMKSLNKEVHIVEGNRNNIKITTPYDVVIYEALLNNSHAN
ncbi:MAG: 2-C-methyl-D-erythritol 4-phosphate cytidylyltransferase [Lachnospiraceae bacterium]|nr:2-C-methyl-D-erythritol 4-phosphate cytidylyltransferase [Lachnospiraceae bacterium]